MPPAPDVPELTDETGLSQTLLRHQLAPLGELGMVRPTRRGRRSVYSRCCGHLAAPAQILASSAALTPEGTEACCTDPLSPGG